MTKGLTALCLCIALASTIPAQKDKITAADLISKHLASIGSPEAIKAAKSRVLVGHGALSSKLGYAGRLTGPAQMAFDGDKFLLAIIFSSKDYPFEKLAFDGRDITYGRAVGNITAGNPDGVGNTRSDRGLTLLGEFVKAQGGVVKSGLFGGVLSSGWALTDVESKKMKAEYGGTESMNGRLVHRLKVRSSNTGDVRVTLFFEGESYRHVATHYEYTIQPHMISSNSTVNATAKASHFMLAEEFSGFKKVNDLILPLGYSITITNQYPNTSEQLTWTLGFSQVFLNEPLEAAVFRVS